MPPLRTDPFDPPLVALSGAFYRGRRIRKGEEFNLAPGDARPRWAAEKGSDAARAAQAPMQPQQANGRPLDKKRWVPVPAHSGLPKRPTKFCGGASDCVADRPPAHAARPAPFPPDD